VGSEKRNKYPFRPTSFCL